MANFRSGYGYVEPNFLSAPRTGQVRGDLPLSDAAKTTIRESADGALMNGQFVVRDAAKGCLELAKELKNAWMVFNEEKLYDERKQAHKDYAMEESRFVDGVMVPRIIKLVVGDTFTTNCFANAAELPVVVGDYVTVGEGGMLKKAAAATAPVALQVVKVYTMPDGEPGVKLEVVEA